MVGTRDKRNESPLPPSRPVALSACKPGDRAGAARIKQQLHWSATFGGFERRATILSQDAYSLSVFCYNTQHNHLYMQFDVCMACVVCLCANTHFSFSHKIRPTDCSAIFIKLGVFKIEGGGTMRFEHPPAQHGHLSSKTPNCMHVRVSNPSR